MPDEQNQQSQTETAQQTQASSPLKQIRTFEGDMAEAISHDKQSLVSIQRAEVARRDALRVLGPKDPQQGVEAEGSKRALVYSLLTIVLLSIGASSVWYAFETYTKKTALPTAEIPINQFISAESLVNIDASTLSRDALLIEVQTEKQKSRGAVEIEQLELRRGTLSDSPLLTTTDFFSRLNTRMPETLVRGFDPLFMLGLLGSSSHTFLLIKLDSFQLSFPGMLEWEPRMIEDILPLFASQTVVETIPTESEFVDVTLNNRDARILKDPTGRTVLLYAFFDNNMLIMTDNEDTFRAVVNRLQSGKLSR